MFFLAKRGHAPGLLGILMSRPSIQFKSAVDFLRGGLPAGATPRRSKPMVVPILAVLVATAFACLAFLQIPAPANENNEFFHNTSAEQASEVLSPWSLITLTHNLAKGILLVIKHDRCGRFGLGIY